MPAGDARSHDFRRTGIELLVESGGAVPVRGGCMAPLIPHGCRARLEKCAAGELTSGDVVALERGGTSYLHRYLGPLSGGGRRLLTKSDRAAHPDRPWISSHLVGRVVAIVRDERSMPFTPSLCDRAMSLVEWLFWIAPVAARWGRAHEL